MDKSTPEKKFRAGAVQATIWKNSGQKGSYRTVQLSRSYKDKNDVWKNANSFRVNDLPKVIIALNKSYEYLVLNKEETPLAKDPVLAEMEAVM